jgi:hypothetical protein
MSYDNLSSVPQNVLKFYQHRRTGMVKPVYPLQLRCGGYNKSDPPLFTGKLLIKFENILRNTTQVIIRHRVKILFSVAENFNLAHQQSTQCVSNCYGSLFQITINIKKLCSITEFIGTLEVNITHSATYKNLNSRN